MRLLHFARFCVHEHKLFLLCISGRKLRNVLCNLLKAGSFAKLRTACMVEKPSKLECSNVVNPFNRVLGFVITYLRFSSSKYPYCIMYSVKYKICFLTQVFNIYALLFYIAKFFYKIVNFYITSNYLKSFYHMEK